jgi:hypothetical protein
MSPSTVLFFETNLGLAASRLRMAKNTIDFLTSCDYRDTDEMLYAKQELRHAQARHAYFVQRLANTMATVDSQTRLQLCNMAHAVGFSLSA